MMKEAKKKRMKLIFLIVAGLALVGGVFWVGKKIGEKKTSQQNPASNNPSKEEKITKLENKIQELQRKIENSPNSENNSQIQQEIEKLKVELALLKRQPFPLPPTPQNPPAPQPELKKTEVEIKWGGGSSKIGYRLFLSADWPQTKIKYFIAENHSAVKNKKFDHLITPKIKLAFPSTKAGSSELIYEENDNDFTLTPLGNWPDEPSPIPPPNPNPVPRNEKKVVFRGENFAFAFFDDMLGPIRVNQTIEKFCADKNHPQIKNLQGKLKSFKEFTIRYGLVDKFESKDNNFIFTFNENNPELEIIEI